MGEMTIETVGVAGAGTMGSQIAQLACLAGYETTLFDPDPEALERGEQALRDGLRRGAESDRWSSEDAEAAAERLQTADEPAGLARCDLVIEAIPERLELKHELVEALTGGDHHPIVATNTSSLSVTAIAAAASDPSRVAGMHFFNPPVLMDLCEVVRGLETADEVLDAVTEVAERMGRTPVRADDRPGFIANRVARPFSLEALRLRGERITDHETLDRICRLGGGFRMGPFELMDLVGVDVNLEVARSFYEQSFGEPRWRPHPLQSQLVAAGRLGRKSGHGWYRYADGEPHRPDDPEPPEADGSGVCVISGEGTVARQLRELAAAAGYTVRRFQRPDERPALIVEALSSSRDAAMRAPSHSLPVMTAADTAMTAAPSLPHAVLLATGSLAKLDAGTSGVGFHCVPPLAENRLVELARSSVTSDAAFSWIESFFQSLGMRTELVGDGPGLTLGRIVCQLVNEASFALMEGVAFPKDIDTAMQLGLNWPRGPLAWGDEIGLDHVLSVLDALLQEVGEDRYRASPVLRRLVAEERLGRAVGAGFHSYAERRKPGG